MESCESVFNEHIHKYKTQLNCTKGNNNTTKKNIINALFQKTCGVFIMGKKTLKIKTTYE